MGGGEGKKKKLQELARLERSQGSVDACCFLLPRCFLGGFLGEPISGDRG